jgi:hypothetical protein
MKYDIFEGTLTVPEGLVDRSVNMLMSADGRGMSIVVSRDRLQAGEDIEHFIKRQMSDLSRQVTKLQEQGRAEAKLGPIAENGPIGIQIASTFKQHGQQIHQFQAIFPMTDDGRVLILTGTSLAPHTEEEKLVWQQLLSTFVVR